MKHPYAPGQESSEHARTVRAEACGFALVVVGLAFALPGVVREHLLAGVVGVALVAIGAAVIASTATAYAHARGAVKAAAVRRAADVAPRSV